MKQIFLIFMIALFSVNVESAQLKNQEERVTNLVIINDCFDIIPRNTPPWEIENSDQGSIIIDLNFALFDNQLVLCTKSVWFSLQNVVQIWHDYVEKSEEELFELFQSGMPDLSIMDTFSFQFEKKNIKNNIKNYKKLISKLDGMYKKLIDEIKQEPDEMTKNSKALMLVQEFQKELYPDGVDNLDYDVRCLFVAYVSYQIILEHNYDCRDVEQDFLLFIPKDLVPKNIQHTKDANTFLGLAYDRFRLYNYKKFATEEETQDVFEAADRAGETYASGIFLLNVLKDLRNFYHINVAQDPFFNVLIVGHGDQNSIAGISIHLKKNENKLLKNSNLLRILDFFNYAMRTKSVGFSSCYPGGKKIAETFDISNQFNNINLEKLSFPIIFVGSFFSYTYGVYDSFPSFSEKNPKLYTSNFLYGLPELVKLNCYRDYFKALNSDPVDYEKAAQSISNVFDFENEKINFDLISNYVSIKYPHSSWFTPVKLITDRERKNVQAAEMKKKQRMKIDLGSSSASDDEHSLGDDTDRLSESINVPLKFAKKISEIEASASPIIKIHNTSTKVVLLQANIINQIDINDAYYKLPTFLPVNHHNQNYVIDIINAPHLDIDNLTVKISPDFHELMQCFLSIPSLEEPVNIVIKEFKTSNASYTNIYAFTQKTLITKKYLFLNKSELVSGYIYTDSKNQTKIVTWPSKENFPTKFSPRAFSSQKALEFIAEVEQKAAKNLKSFENIESMLATEPKPEVVEKVERSKMLYKQEQAAKTIQKNYRKYKSNRALKTA